MEGNRLTESLEYCTATQLVGKSVTLSVELLGEDRWRQSGTTEATKVSVNETYKRVK